MKIIGGVCVINNYIRTSPPLCKATIPSTTKTPKTFMNASLLETNPFDMTLGEQSRRKIMERSRDKNLVFTAPTVGKRFTTYGIIVVDDLERKRKTRGEILRSHKWELP